ncbi:MAG: hypothetical protein WCI19_11885 [Betaproteobacteria bacterium]|nr:hypothetical protein [Rhodocyclales bacterium]
MPPAIPSADFDQRFERAFGLAAYVSNRYIVSHMRRVMLELGIDLDSAFILGTLSQLNVAAQFPPGVDPLLRLDVSGLVPDPHLTPVRLADLSQITQLPRETVRRKLEKLRKLGKVERTAAGAWQLSDTNMDEATRAFTRETVLRLLAVAQDVNKVLGY